MNKFWDWIMVFEPIVIVLEGIAGILEIFS